MKVKLYIASIVEKNFTNKGALRLIQQYVEASDVKLRSVKHAEQLVIDVMAEMGHLMLPPELKEDVYDIQCDKQEVEEIATQVYEWYCAKGEE